MASKIHLSVLSFRLQADFKTLYDPGIKTNITHAIRSDHSAITLRIRTETLDTGYWKLNIALLEKSQFVEEMRI